MLIRNAKLSTGSIIRKHTTVIKVYYCGYQKLDHQYKQTTSLNKRPQHCPDQYNENHISCDTVSTTYKTQLYSMNKNTMHHYMYVDMPYI